MPSRRARSADGGPVGRDRCPRQVENARDRERLVAVPLALVSPPDQRDVLTAHERHRTGQPRECACHRGPRRGRGPCSPPTRSSIPPGSRNRRARRRRRARSGLGRSPCRRRAPTRAQEAAEHDAAIAADDDEKSIVVEPGRDSIGERPAVGGHARLVPGLAGRTLEVLVGRRQHVAEVRRVQPLDQAQVPERLGRAIHLLRRTGLIVRPEADARWRSQDCDMCAQGKATPWRSGWTRRT